MMLDHERIEELLAAHVLGGLDPADERELADARARHGAECAECGRLERELSEVAGLLPFVLDPEPVDPMLADAILAVARSDQPVATRGPDQLAERRGERERRRGGRRWTVALGVAAVLVAAVALVTTVLPSPVEVTRAEPAGRSVRFEPAGGFEGDLTMVYTPGESGAVLWGEVPDPGEGNVYEVWTFEGDTPASSGCVSPVDGRLALAIDADVGATELMAVTVESSDCPAQPTTQPVLVAPLTTA